ncbi:deleted in lung and esophageal cancer protein 1-like isoform X2 [Bolinopsis microptera]|uniref:deleted in lung and esophageal cancer protein 1-like isoform X2 n=1 Tax=Bolinopsis microptera TaxID=2820187 RepID=UPI00307A14AE
MDHALVHQRPDDCSREPVMRPARPSSPRNQDVSYVLSSVFGDLYSQDVLQDDTIINLETSRTHDPDFHDYYVQLLNEIRTERTERLAALKTVEEHMVSAFNLASEQNMVLQSEESQNNLGIPERHVGISSYLDEEMLAKYNLLTPGSYLRPSPPSLNPPSVPELPNFMKNTEVMEEHERARMIPINRDTALLAPAKIKRSTLSAGYIKVQAPTRNAWRDSMHPDVRIEEQKGLEKLQAKSHFLKTKRFGKDETEEQIFCTVPSKIHFENYKIGENYEQKLKIKNVSNSSRQLKVLPPRTKYFTISKSADPSQGAIAPGLSVEYTVTFLPGSLGLHLDELQIIPQGGALTNVPLVGERPPPKLSLPDILDCGYCLVNGTLKTQFRCKNSGGHGIFQLYPHGTISDPFLFNDLLPPKFTFESNGFTVTPTSFALDTGDEVVIDVEFRPGEVARSTTKFTLTVDNCTQHDYSLTAESQSCRVQTIAVSGGESTVDYDIRNEESVEPVTINFEDQNPGTTEEKIFILRNCVNVPLHFNWEVCKILTEEEKGESVLLSADPQAPFQISPAIGILDPAAEATFSITCNPQNAGKYENMARLWVDDIPAMLPSGIVLERFDALHITLTHLTQPHQIKLDPPALVIPGENVVGNMVSKTVKIVNESLSDTNVRWSWPEGDLKVCVHPESLTVGAGSSRTVQIDVESLSAGDKEIHLTCSLENVDKPLKLFLKAKFRGPRVTISGDREDPAIDFGFIHFRENCSVQRQFEIINHDGVHAKWSLAEVDHCVDKDYGQSEFQFSETGGEIGPYEVRALHVIFRPHLPRSLKSFIECTVENGTGNKLRVVGEIQEPNVVLKQSSIDLGVIYMGVPVKSQIVFESLNFADSSFTVASAEGRDKQFGHIEFDKMSSSIYAGGTHTIPFKFTGREAAKIEDFTVVFNMDGGKVLALGIKAEVRGLHIVHETPDVDQIAPETGAEQLEAPILDFGTTEILTPTSRVLKIINKSHISTSFNLRVIHFDGAGSVPPPLSARGMTNLSERTFRSASNLLTRSNALLDPKSKSRKQNDQEYWKGQLKDNKGACFIASPASGYLPGNGVTIVTIHANCDMWGQYSDVLVSQVGDMEAVEIPIKLNAINSPLYYKLSNNNKPTVRFGSYPLNEQPVSRTVHISNQGPVNIRLDWETFNIVPEDDTLIDLNFHIGDAFPDKSGDKEEVEEDGDLIRLKVVPHEGERSTGPFSFSPDQCVIPARGSSKVTLLFDPKYGIGKCDGNYHSFALAYQSLKGNKNSGLCTRSQGEQVPPLKIMMTGKVEVPEVVVTAEEHGFTFKLMAGIINSRVREHTKIHKMSLLNGSKLHLLFKISASLPFTLLDDKVEYTLTPRQKIKLDHGLVLSEKLLSSLLGSSKQSFRLEFNKSEGGFVESEEGRVEVNVEEQLLHKTHEVNLSDGSVETIVQQVPEKRYHLHSHLLLNYNNGHQQNIPVHCRIVLPTFYISPGTVQFGTCLVGQTSHLTVRLINPSNSPLRWTSVYSGDTAEGDFVISPSSGEFTRADSVLLNLTFTAKSCKPSRGTYTFTGTPGNRTLHLSLEGVGSHDERMQRLL